VIRKPSGVSPKSAHPAFRLEVVIRFANVAVGDGRRRRLSAGSRLSAVRSAVAAAPYEVKTLAAGNRPTAASDSQQASGRSHRREPQPEANNASRAHRREPQASRPPPPPTIAESDVALFRD